MKLMSMNQIVVAVPSGTFSYYFREYYDSMMTLVFYLLTSF